MRPRCYFGNLALAVLKAALCGWVIVLSSASGQTVPQPSDGQTVETRKRLEERDQYGEEAARFRDEGRLIEAIVAAEKMLVIEREVLGKDHEDVLGTLDLLSELYVEQLNFDAARAARAEVLATRQKGLAADHWQVTDARLALAHVERLAKLDPSQRARLDKAHELGDQAMREHAQGHYHEAIAPASQSQEICEQVLGPEHPDTIASLNNVGLIYQSMGDLTKAEPLLRRSLEASEKVLGLEHPGTAVSLLNLGEVHISMGDFSKGAPFLERSLEINEKALGPEHSNTATSLNSLGSLYDAMGDPARAEPFLRRSLEIWQKVLGPEHPDTATSLNNLGALYHGMRDYAKAEPLYRRSLDIVRRALGPEHPETAASLGNLGSLYQTMGDYAKAESLYRSALDVAGNGLGLDDLFKASSLRNLGLLYQAMGDDARAEPLFREALAIARGNLELAAAVQSQRQQLAMTMSLRRFLDSYISLSSTIGAHADLAYENVLRWKGAVITRQRESRAVADHPELADTYRELQTTTRRLATMALSAPAPQQQEAWHGQIDELTAEKERLEADLAKQSGEFRAARQEITVRDVVSNLPANAVLVDYLEYRHFTPAPKSSPGPGTSERRLVAFILRPDQELKLVPLGPAKAVGDAVDAWRATYGRSAGSREAGSRLRAQIWEPLESSLAGATLVLISPDGVLGRFPFAALPGAEPGKYLLQERSLAIVPVAQALPALMTGGHHRRPEGNLLVIGGVDYDATEGQLADPDPARPKKVFGRRAERGSAWRAFAPLDGTLGELATIEKLYQDTFGHEGITVLRKREPSESRFWRESSRHLYLHVATHGYFAPPELRSALQGDGRSNAETRLGAAGQSMVMGRAPGMLSGLALAGANRSPNSEGDDGILTADEVENVDLRGVELAVLSACETGLGDVAGGEGLLGLQRAFQVGGAQTVVATLWKVHDEQTRALMERFYRNLWENDLSKLEALREAQLWMLREGPKRGLVREEDTDSENPLLAPPYYWAPFVLSGDWR